jgi:hypothetical protein
MIVLLGRVSWGCNYFYSVPKIPHSMPFLLLRFLLRNLLLFSWVYLIHSLFFLSYRLKYSFSVPCACFNDNILWGDSIVEVCLVFWRLPVPEWGKTLSRLGTFSVIILLNMLHISLFNAHDSQVQSFDGVTEFSHIPFIALVLFD